MSSTHARGWRLTRQAASVTIEVGGTAAQAVSGALGVEVGGGLPKVDAEVLTTGDRVIIRLEADDAPSLRAALNSFLRWAQMAAEVSTGVDAPKKDDHE